WLFILSLDCILRSQMKLFISWLACILYIYIYIYIYATLFYFVVVFIPTFWEKGKLFVFIEISK
ncbi:MAG: hypothetical protein N7Q72_07245, partial [Spiroplasma sp. Tabriz.8]|nr:hypothetical protein [Spiroplasma sp. Tabriz.8]